MSRPQQRAIKRTRLLAVQCCQVLAARRSAMQCGGRPEVHGPEYPIPGLRLAGWSWVDAGRDDIQVSAAASNGGGDSQRAGSIGEARARRGAGSRCRPDRTLNAGCRMRAGYDTYVQCDTAIHNDTTRRDTVDTGRRHGRKSSAADAESHSHTVESSAADRNSSHKVGQ